MFDSFMPIVYETRFFVDDKLENLLMMDIVLMMDMASILLEDYLMKTYLPPRKIVSRFYKRMISIY